MVFSVQDAAHPVLNVFQGSDVALEITKIFRWWSMTPAKGQLGTVVDVPARFNDPDQSIAMAEKKFGAGRVFMSAIPADKDWHIWPINGTYVVAMQELARHMAGNVAGSGTLRAGETLLHTVNVADYKTDAELRTSPQRKVNLQAREPGAKNGNGAEPPAPVEELPGGQTQWQYHYDQTGQRGFYELRLSRNDGQEEKLLFAVNADPSEGDLSRVDLTALRTSFGDAPVKIISAASASSLAGAGSQRELWKYLLIGVAVVLCGEQLLAWFFGWRR